MVGTDSAGNGHGPPTPRNAAEATLTEAQLRVALGRGVITAAQMQQLLALSRESMAAEDRELDREDGGVSFAHLLYWAGTFAVLFALGYFLVDKWRSLKPAGVLGVTTLYALAFVLASRFLWRLRYRAASGLFALLAVGMVPVMTWALESMAGIWPTVPDQRGPFTTDLLATIRWIPIELSAALAALVALRRGIQLSVLTVAATLPFAMALVHATPLVFEPEHDWILWGWIAIVASSLLLIGGAEIERRTGRAVDHAGWAYLTGLGFLIAGIVSVTPQSRAIPHSLPAVVVLLGVASLAARRLVFLLFGGVLFVGWLGFLAGSVFQTATGFMIVTVAAGALLILGTVTVQSRFPGLLRAFSDTGAPRSYRALALGFGAACLASLALVAVANARAPGLARERYARELEASRRAAQARAIARQRTVPGPVPAETPARSRP